MLWTLIELPVDREVRGGGVGVSALTHHNYSLNWLSEHNFSSFTLANCTYSTNLHTFVRQTTAATATATRSTTRTIEKVQHSLNKHARKPVAPRPKLRFRLRRTWGAAELKYNQTKIKNQESCKLKQLRRNYTVRISQKSAIERERNKEGVRECGVECEK